MKPGIYFDMPWDEYRAIDLPSPSMQKHGLRSMRHLKRGIDGELKPNEKTVAIGQCVHCMVANEMDRIAVMPQFELDEANVTATGKRSKSKATSYYKDESEKWRSENQHKQVLTDKQFADAKHALAQLRANQHAARLLDRSALEVSVIGEIEGVLCKTRMDGLWLKERRGWDLKTCPDVSPVQLYRHAKKMGYFFQFEFQRLCLQSLGHELERYDILALEVAGDFDCGVIEVPLALLDVWADKVRSVMIDYREAKRTNKWTGIYPTGCGELQVPNWDMGDDDQVEEWGSDLQPMDDETTVYF